MIIIERKVFVPGERTKSAPMEIDVLWYCLIIFLPVLIFREAAQLMVSGAAYFHSIENIVETVLVILTSLLLLWGDYCDHKGDKRYLSSIAIVLSWSLFITMLGRHPMFGTYNIFITMFYKVKYFQDSDNNSLNSLKVIIL